MQKPIFTIKYNLYKPDEISINIENKKFSFHAKELLCEFLNSFDPFFQFHLSVSQNKEPEVYPYEYLWHIGEEEPAPHRYYTFFDDGFEIEIDENEIRNNRILRDLANKLLNEIGYYGVKYSPSNNKITVPNIRAHSNLREYNSNISIEYFLTFDPYYYGLLSHYNELLDTFADIIVDMYSNKATSFFQKLYIHSDEFIKETYLCFLKIFAPQFIVNAEYPSNKNDLFYLSYELPHDLSNSHFTFSRTKYYPTPSDFINNYIKYSGNELRLKIADYYTNKIKNDSEECMLLTHILQLCENDLPELANLILDVFYSPSKKGLVTSYCFKNYLCLVTYESFETHTQKQIGIPFPCTPPEYVYPGFAIDTYSSDFARLLMWYLPFERNPFVKPIIDTNTDICTYLSNVTTHVDSHEYRDFQKILRASVDLEKEGTIHTNSLITLILCLFDANTTFSGSLIRRCSGCQRFFVLETGQQRYCSIECRTQAKQKQNAHIPKTIEKLYSSKRNRQNLFKESTDDTFCIENLKKYVTPNKIEWISKKFLSYLMTGIKLNIYDCNIKTITSILRTNNADAETMFKVAEDLLAPVKASDILIPTNLTDALPLDKMKNQGLSIPYSDWQSVFSELINSSTYIYPKIVCERLKLMKKAFKNYEAWLNSQKTTDSNTLANMPATKFMNSLFTQDAPKDVCVTSEPSRKKHSY